MITLHRFRLLEAELRRRGHGPMIEWSETIAAPANAEEFAERAIYVISNSGMANTVGAVIYTRCMDALRAESRAADVFGHRGKSQAIDTIWRDRQALFEAYSSSDERHAFLETLPWIGPVTAHHLAKNLGSNTAKPDVHLERLARAEATTTAELCARLSQQSGYNVATVDSILWRACADRVLNSRLYEKAGWDAAFQPAAAPSVAEPGTADEPPQS